MDTDGQPVMVVKFSEALLEQIREHAAAAYPEECCGMLLGRENSIVQVVAAANTTDVGDRRNRYAIDPREILRVDREAHAQGLEIVGYYHSHPDHPAVPSKADRAMAWEGVLYVIVPTTAEGAGTPRGWRLRSTGDFSEMALTP